MNSLDLIGELLPAHSRAENGLKKKRTDIGELLQRMAELMQFRAAEKKQQVITELPPHPVYLTLNDVKIERVISNLLANAIKFSPIGGNIILHMHTDRDFVVISVKDDGIGIDTDGLEHIFDEFTSLKRKGTAGEPSFGLGLSISKQIVEEEGGTIWAESSRGNGSTFFIRLPGYR
jgi:signal transduction histidine kinase